MTMHSHPRGKREPDQIDLLVASNIRQLRLAAGLSQGALARQIGVTYQQVQKYETGVDRLSSSRLWRCAKALKVPVGALFDGVNPWPP